MPRRAIGRSILKSVRIRDLLANVDGWGGFFTASEPQFLDTSEIITGPQKTAYHDMYQN